MHQIQSLPPAVVFGMKLLQRANKEKNTFCSPGIELSTDRNIFMCISKSSRGKKTGNVLYRGKGRRNKLEDVEKLMNNLSFKVNFIFSELTCAEDKMSSE